MAYINVVNFKVEVNSDPSANVDVDTVYERILPLLEEAARTAVHGFKLDGITLTIEVDEA